MRRLRSDYYSRRLLSPPFLRGGRRLLEGLTLRRAPDHLPLRRFRSAEAFAAADDDRGRDDDRDGGGATTTTPKIRLLSKSLYEDSRKCHRLGWYARRNRLPSTTTAKTDPMRAFLVREGLRFERYVYDLEYGYRGSEPTASSSSSSKKKNDEDDTGAFPPPSHLAMVRERSPVKAAEATRILMERRDHRSVDGEKRDDRIDTLLQPTFLSGNLVARADVAIRRSGSAAAAASSSSSSDARDDDDEDEEVDDGRSGGDDDDDVDSWEILEIKSSTAKSFRKKIPDLAYTVCVARAAGCAVERASLILVDPTYVGGDHRRRLYKTVDCTDLVDRYLLENDALERAATVDAITGERDDDGGRSSVPPPVKYKLACGKCELLGVECGPPRPTVRDDESGVVDDDEEEPTAAVAPLKHGIWELPRLSKKQFPDVLERARPTLELAHLDLTPEEEEEDEDGSSTSPLLTESQLRFYRAVASGSANVDDRELEARLAGIAAAGPEEETLYLDFEAVSVLRPPHPGMVPYETMVTQYSLHRRDPHGNLHHSEYLADPRRDCRRELLDRLLDDLGCPGDGDESGGGRSPSPVLVYSPYERTQLRKLADLFPDRSDAIRKVVDRLVDLERIVKDCVSHPGFGGRSSIKVTLPALVPGFERAYRDLGGGIADGAAAGAAFAEMLVVGDDDGAPPSEDDEETVRRTRTALLDYCKLDTLALVEIHGALRKLLVAGNDDDDDDGFESSSSKAAVAKS